MLNPAVVSDTSAQVDLANSLILPKCQEHVISKFLINYTLSEAWSGVNWADRIAAQGAFGINFMTGLPER